jgi:nucleotide-binding universal stress UspA family protein
MKGAVMRRVLVPTDFTEAALLVTREALSWVDAIEGELLLLHVVPDIFLGWLDHLAISFIDQSRLESTYEDLCAEGHRKFSTWLPYQAHERCRTLVVVGDTADAIIEVAQVEAADMIIMRVPHTQVVAPHPGWQRDRYRHAQSPRAGDCLGWPRADVLQ